MKQCLLTGGGAGAVSGRTTLFTATCSFPAGTGPVHEPHRPTPTSTSCRLSTQRKNMTAVYNKANAPFGALTERNVMQSTASLGALSGSGRANAAGSGRSERHTTACSSIAAALRIVTIDTSSLLPETLHPPGQQHLRRCACVRAVSSPAQSRTVLCYAARYAPPCRPPHSLRLSMALRRQQSSCLTIGNSRARPAARLRGHRRAQAALLLENQRQKMQQIVSLLSLVRAGVACRCFAFSPAVVTTIATHTRVCMRTECG